MRGVKGQLRLNGGAAVGPSGIISRAPARALASPHPSRQAVEAMVTNEEDKAPNKAVEEGTPQDRRDEEMRSHRRKEDEMDPLVYASKEVSCASSPRPSRGRLLQWTASPPWADEVHHEMLSPVINQYEYITLTWRS